MPRPDPDLALELLCSRNADYFALRLAQSGRKIVVKPEFDDGPAPARWQLNNLTEYTPPWCDPCDLPGQKLTHKWRRSAPSIDFRMEQALNLCGWQIVPQ
jgi:hypothetical protein